MNLEETISVSHCCISSYQHIPVFFKVLEQAHNIPCFLFYCSVFEVISFSFVSLNEFNRLGDNIEFGSTNTFQRK